jgi:hypothetical protein
MGSSGVELSDDMDTKKGSPDDPSTVADIDDDDIDALIFTANKKKSGIKKLR